MVDNILRFTEPFDTPVNEKCWEILNCHKIWSVYAIYIGKQLYHSNEFIAHQNEVICDIAKGSLQIVEVRACDG